MFKKIFGGKRDKGKAKDGTDIYTYENTRNGKQGKVAEMMNTEDIIAHFDKMFPGRETNVFHEIISDIVHIDVHCMEPTDEEPFRVLYTTGMSDLPMTMPSEIENEWSHLKRAELMIFIPESWPIDSKAFKDERYYWPVRLLKQLARFPHEYNTWLGYGHTIPNSNEYDPYAENTELNGVILNVLKEEISSISTKDGNLINVYSLVPLYKEEMDYKLEYGSDSLFEKLAEVQGSGFWIDASRKNVCR
ncbi:suppressor of fused domain protein [Tepidibacter hydrothermalis]|uniref:Suppressor of fused domain protein n=1 Tax=Tepidibacter hydrothermalis TaxID=3036126 RepID=A0ABY8EFU7_9FIRM|nr:suppressor of fused domain protein [Tepidibacter hydrothermalis]WFD11826.1 suppressor of fused domain protein [Tepidibacter hydrothermalis]